MLTSAKAGLGTLHSQRIVFSGTLLKRCHVSASWLTRTRRRWCSPAIYCLFLLYLAIYESDLIQLERAREKRNHYWFQQFLSEVWLATCSCLLKLMVFLTTSYSKGAVSFPLLPSLLSQMLGRLARILWWLYEVPQNYFLVLASNKLAKRPLFYMHAATQTIDLETSFSPNCFNY